MKKWSSLAGTAVIVVFAVVIAVCWYSIFCNEKMGRNIETFEKEITTNKGMGNNSRKGEKEKQFIVETTKKRMISEREPFKEREKKDEELKDVVAQYSWKLSPEILEEIVSEEPADPMWSDEVRSKLTKHMEEHGIEGMKIVEVNCRKRICKLTMSHDDKESLREYRDEICRSEAMEHKEMHGTSRETENGKYESISYFSKPDDDEVFEEVLDRIAAKVKR